MTHVLAYQSAQTAQSSDSDITFCRMALNGDSDPTSQEAVQKMVAKSGELDGTEIYYWDDQ